MSTACVRCATPIPSEGKFCPGCGSEATTRFRDAVHTDGSGPRPALPPRYRIEKFLGRGGMGRVFLCRDLTLDVDIALKVLPAEFAADDEALGMMRREARAAARFRECGGILSLYGFEQFEDTFFLVMEYAAGGALDETLRADGRMSVPECRRIGTAVAEALQFAHAQGVLHRDIKPANVLLDGDGNPKVADFGIAKVLSDASSKQSHMTVAGTPTYMAPEIILREKVDRRADLYSLGCMLYEMSTGQRPFKGTYVEIAMMKTAPGVAAPDPRDVVPDLPDDFVAVVRRLLDRNPEQRFATAAECASALAGETPAVGSAHDDDEPTEIAPSGDAQARAVPHERSSVPSQAARRRPIWLLLLAAAVVAVIAVAGPWRERSSAPGDVSAATAREVVDGLERELEDVAPAVAEETTARFDMLLSEARSSESQGELTSAVDAYERLAAELRREIAAATTRQQEFDRARELSEQVSRLREELTVAPVELLAGAEGELTRAQVLAEKGRESTPADASSDARAAVDDLDAARAILEPLVQVAEQRARPLVDAALGRLPALSTELEGERARVESRIRELERQAGKHAAEDAMLEGSRRVEAVESGNVTRAELSLHEVVLSSWKDAVFARTERALARRSEAEARALQTAGRFAASLAEARRAEREWERLRCECWRSALVVLAESGGEGSVSPEATNAYAGALAATRRSDDRAASVAYREAGEAFRSAFDTGLSAFLAGRLRVEVGLRCTSCDATGVCADCKGAGSAFTACDSCSSSGKVTSHCAACTGTGRTPCATCGGEGTLRKACSACSGKGAIACSACDASGRRACSHCRASGYTKCAPCKGSGKVAGSTGDVACGTCSGSGSAKCKQCDGRRKTACGTCSARGNVSCRTCRGGGSVTSDCSDCRGAKRRTCIACEGAGVRTSACAECGGASGKHACRSCKGDRRCGHCAGRGRTGD